MNEADASASGRPWRAASYPFNDHGKSMVMGQTDGFVKMIDHLALTQRKIDHALVDDIGSDHHHVLGKEMGLQNCVW